MSDKESRPLQLENEDIVFADLTNREALEAVVVCKSGQIYLYDLDEHTKKPLAKLLPELGKEYVNTAKALNILEDLTPSELNQLLETRATDDQPLETLLDEYSHFFPISPLKLKLHSFKNYACLVQERGVAGIVLNLRDPNFQKILKRGEYHVDHCMFPIAFYEHESRTYLIHGTDWNRLDITCLDTDELLTNRTQKHSDYFDYFHSSLSVSPGAKYFSSNGWVWGPCDVVSVYSIEEFLIRYEDSSCQLDIGTVDGYNWDRPLCWIDDQTLGIGYNRREADDGNGSFRSEILFVNIHQNEVIGRVDFDSFALSDYGAPEGELYFDSEMNRFVGLNSKSGLFVTDIDGVEISRDASLTSHQYSLKHMFVYRFDLTKRELEIFEHS